MEIQLKRDWRRDVEERRGVGNARLRKAKKIGQNLPIHKHTGDTNADRKETDRVLFAMTFWSALFVSKCVHLYY